MEAQPLVHPCIQTMCAMYFCGFWQTRGAAGIEEGAQLAEDSSAVKGCAARAVFEAARLFCCLNRDDYHELLP